ncbi:hypothetical protein ACHAWF_017918 [Thalassiosira exigua]
MAMLGIRTSSSSAGTSAAGRKMALLLLLIARGASASSRRRFAVGPARAAFAPPPSRRRSAVASTPPFGPPIALAPRPPCARWASTADGDRGGAGGVPSLDAEESEILVDPYSDAAASHLEEFCARHDVPGDPAKVRDALLRLTEEVVAWNDRINLVSRKDCNPATVYHRHVLPSVALLPLIMERPREGGTLEVIDVGTGGGFPGLPLALLLRDDARFTLVDSVRKKLVAVSEMAEAVGATNVRVHCGRAEEMCAEKEGRRTHRRKYDVALGRSVAALPRFCGWVSDLLKRRDVDADEGDDAEEGRLVYIVGGELDDLVESRIARDVPLDELLRGPGGTSDKRALIFDARDVEDIATESGEKRRVVRSAPPKKSRPKDGGKGGRKKLARGEWGEKRNDVKKQRGYDDFQRYEF